MPHPSLQIVWIRPRSLCADPRVVATLEDLVAALADPHIVAALGHSLQINVDISVVE